MTMSGRWRVLARRRRTRIWRSKALRAPLRLWMLWMTSMPSFRYSSPRSSGPEIGHCLVGPSAYAGRRQFVDGGVLLVGRVILVCWHSFHGVTIGRLAERLPWGGLCRLRTADACIQRPVAWRRSMA